MPSDAPSVFAIVPAAGRSRRMNRCKQLLEIDGMPMLLRIVEQLIASRIAGIAIVTRREIEDALSSHPAGGPRLRSWRDGAAPGVFFAYNESAEAEMIDSVRIGLNTWKQHATISGTDGFLVCPGDHPGVSTADFNDCIAAFQNAPDRIVIASHDGRRGHPVIFPASLSHEVHSPACDGGLNTLPRVRADLVLEAPCGSRGVLWDIDTPDDAERL